MTRTRELIELLKRNLERAERLSYLEWQSSRFHEQELRTQHIRIVEAIRSRNPQAAREALLSDIVEGQRNTMKFGKEVLGLRIGISDGARARMNRKRIWVHPADPEPFERQNLFIGPSRPFTIAFSAQRGLRGCDFITDRLEHIVVGNISARSIGVGDHDRVARTHRRWEYIRSIHWRA